MLLISTCAIFAIQERPAHTRTWNLKAALGPKPCKLNQQYQHTSGNQNNMCSPKRFLIILQKKSNSFTKKSTVQSCPICSVARIQKSSRMRLAKKFPDKRHFLVYIQPRSSTICCLKRHPNQDHSTYILRNFTYGFTFILQQPNLKPQTHGLLFHFTMLPARVSNDVSQDSA